jgi:hypothetical protein
MLLLLLLLLVLMLLLLLKMLSTLSLKKPFAFEKGKIQVRGSN